MKAVIWHGKHDVRVETVSDPEIVNPRDAIIKITSTAICGSDLHLYDGFIPTMKSGDILGHEFMGEVVDVGRGVSNLAKGDRVVVPFGIACGNCWFCQQTLFAACDNSNPNGEMMAAAYGHGGAGLFGYSHMMGGFSGGQAEYARVPYADVGPIKVPAHLDDEKVLFLSDIFPTAYMAAENCAIQPGDTVAVWGAGPVGQLVIKCCFLLGAGRVISIDHVPERRAMAKRNGAIALEANQDEPMTELLSEMTGGRGPDSCIEAVGLESHGASADSVYDTVKTSLFMATDKGHALRQAIMACRKNGTVSIPGVYGGVMDKFPIGAAFGKGLTLKMGQTHTQRYMRPLLRHIENGDIDPSDIITHRIALSEASGAYSTFHKKEDNCVKVVLKP